MDNAFLRKLTEITEANYGDATFNVEELSRRMGLSSSSLRRRLNAYAGKSVNQFIREVRLRKALEILQKEDIPVSEVAYQTGFSSPNYFITCFHEHFGYPPGESKKIVPLNGKEELQPVGVIIENSDTLEKIGKRGRKLNRTNWLIIAAILVILAGAGAFYYWNLFDSSGKNKSAAVLPFRNLSGDAETQRFSSGLEEQLRNELNSLKFLDIRSRVSAERFNNPSQLMPEIGKALNADYIIEGSVDRQGDVYQVYIKLIETKTDKTTWSESYNRQKENLFNLRNEVVEDIIHKMKSVFLLKDVTPENAGGSKNREAESLFMQGSFFSKATDFNPEKALEFYRSALRLDPGFAEAYLGIAYILSNLYTDVEMRHDSMLGAATAAIEQAFALCPGISLVDEQLGFLYYAREDYIKSLAACSVALRKNPESTGTFYTMAGAWLRLGEWIKAEACLKRVLEMNTNSFAHEYLLGATFEHLRDFSRARIHYREVSAKNPTDGSAIYGLAMMSLKTEGDPAKARNILDSLSSASKPRGLDSLSLYYQYALINLFAGKYQEAINRLKGWPRATAPGPPYYCRPACLVRAMIYGYLHDREQERIYYDSTRIFLEGLQAMSAANLNNPRVNSALGIAYAGLGLTALAIAQTEKVRAELLVKPDAFFGPFAMEDVAFIFTSTGRHSEALSVLRQLLSEPGPLTTTLLELDPRWAPLRHHPDYKRLLKEFYL